MPATIRIKNLRLRTYIGINDDERAKRQDVVINARISYDARGARSSDDIDDAFNYRDVTKAIIKEVEEARYDLLEKLTQAVLDTIMASGQVHAATVEVDKPHALRFADSVSLELSARRD